AREGKEIERQPRPVLVKIVYCPVFHPETGTGKLEIHCGKGTYVRTLIHDMGQALGCGAVMTGLRRGFAGGFSLNECYTLEEVQKFADENRIGEILIPIEKAFSTLPKIVLTQKQTVHYRNGVKMSLSQFREQLTEQHIRYAVYGTPDGFLGTALVDSKNDLLRIERNLYQPKEVNV
ncbi:MAG: tRNA pseudouridine(55) synthase TruB, partial [Oscillospiraceae bacterium]|nr:tRNA pseudouridine(55) synthase TruB [Oscillospiraceae bacterium]